MPRYRALSIPQKEFCKEYLRQNGNATKAYMKAYKTKNADSARKSASNLMKNPKIKAIIDNILEENGLNDTTIDAHLLFLIKQFDNFSAKIAGIKEYNKLKRRGGYDRRKKIAH